MYDTLVRPVITEKSMLSSEAGKVTFLVPLSASKEDVKAAVEAIFNVKVNKVNTIRQFGKTKRFRGYEDIHKNSYGFENKSFGRRVIPTVSFRRMS